MEIVFIIFGRDISWHDFKSDHSLVVVIKQVYEYITAHDHCQYVIHWSMWVWSIYKLGGLASPFNAPINVISQLSYPQQTQGNLNRGTFVSQNPHLSCMWVCVCVCVCMCVCVCVCVCVSASRHWATIRSYTHSVTVLYVDSNVCVRYPWVDCSIACGTTLPGIPSHSSCLFHSSCLLVNNAGSPLGPHPRGCCQIHHSP